MTIKIFYALILLSRMELSISITINRQATGDSTRGVSCPNETYFGILDKECIQKVEGTLLLKEISQFNALRKKCAYQGLFWSVFSRIRTEYGECSVRIQSKCAKILCISPYSVRMRENTGQNNSKYGHFSRSDELAMCNSDVIFLDTLWHYLVIAITTRNL